MNPGRWLILSVVLNLALACVIGWRVLARPAVVTPPPAAPPQPVVRKVVETNEVVRPGSVVRQDWKSVEDEEYRNYIAHLRAIGCPEDTIRDIIILDINKQYLDRLREAHPPKPFKFWDTSQSFVFRAGRNNEDRERDNYQLALTREKSGLVRELLGVELAEELAKYHMSTSRADLEDMWTFLPADKRKLVQQIQAKYADLMQAVRLQADPDGRLAPELLQQLKELKVKQEAELAQAMTPAELEQYQLRMTTTATNLRLALSAFEPTEDEFKRLFPLRKAYDDVFADPTFDRNDPAQMQRRTEAYREMEEKMRGVLTPERYAEYVRSRDDNYRNEYQFAKVWQLPAGTATKLFEIRRATDAQVQTVRADQSLDTAARTALLASIQTEAQNTLRQTLGDRVYQGYVRSRGGRTGQSLE